MQERDIHYAMTLFVTGATIRSVQAIANVRAFCEKELSDNYRLEVVDLCDTPERARLDQILAAPTLVRHDPKPARRLIGDMSNQDRLNDMIKLA